MTAFRYAFILLLVAALGCSKNKTGNTGFVGKWQRMQVYISPGGAGYWQASNDNPKVKLELTASGNVISNREPYSKFATYKIVGTDSIEFTSTSGQKTYNRYELTSGKLDIWFSCFEGCADRFAPSRVLLQ